MGVPAKHLWRSVTTEGKGQNIPMGSTSVWLEHHHPLGWLCLLQCCQIPHLAVYSTRDTRNWWWWSYSGAALHTVATIPVDCWLGSIVVNVPLLDIGRSWVWTPVGPIFSLPTPTRCSPPHSTATTTCQLQAQEKVAIQEHWRLVQESSRVQLFDCVICIEKYSVDPFAVIKSCNYILCRTCMKEHVQSHIMQSIWPIWCPVCVADHSQTEVVSYINTFGLCWGLIDSHIVSHHLQFSWNTGNRWSHTCQVSEVGDGGGLCCCWMSEVRDCDARMLKLKSTTHHHSCHKTTPVGATDFQQAKELTLPFSCGAHWCKQCNRIFQHGGVHSCDRQAEMDQLLGQKNWKKCLGMSPSLFSPPVPLAHTSVACQVPVEKILW